MQETRHGGRGRKECRASGVGWVVCAHITITVGIYNIDAFILEISFMGTIQRVSKWGSSLAIQIPKSLAEQCDINDGESVQVVVSRNRLVISKHAYDLATMVDQITSNNIHREQDFGTPFGKESW